LQPATRTTLFASDNEKKEQYDASYYKGPTYIKKPMFCSSIRMSDGDDLSSSSSSSISNSKSIDRRQRKDAEKKRMPLSQAWYKAKQINLSKNQKRLMNDLFPVHGIVLHYGEVLSLEKIFPDNNKVTLDIGFGMGDSIVGMALNHREESNHVFIGCEIHKAGIASVLGKIQEHELTTIKLIRADISMLLEHHLKPHCLDEVCIYFPDPWPNTERDGERRVVRKQIIDLLSKKMKSKGKLRIATDVKDYAQHVTTVMMTFPQFHLNYESEHIQCQDGPSWRPITKYESRAVELGNKVWDFEYELIT